MPIRKLSDILRTGASAGISSQELKDIMQEDQREIDSKAVPAVIGEGNDSFSDAQIVEAVGQAVQISQHIGSELLAGMGVEDPTEGEQ
ncbi:MAG TPA: hypothetical protein VFH39_03810 [Candidatus Saccharimonadales bacterium]|nr:hypothetical protein [Candidatus Saccharimonadales bacterium]